MQSCRPRKLCKTTNLRKLGADYVFDTTFSADLTIMEEGTELLQRLQAGDLDNQPMFTSCLSLIHIYRKPATYGDRLSLC